MIKTWQHHRKHADGQEPPKEEFICQFALADVNRFIQVTKGAFLYSFEILVFLLLIVCKYAFILYINGHFISLPTYQSLVVNYFLGTYTQCIKCQATIKT